MSLTNSITTPFKLTFDLDIDLKNDDFSYSSVANLTTLATIVGDRESEYIYDDMMMTIVLDLESKIEELYFDHIQNENIGIIRENALPVDLILDLDEISLDEDEFYATFNITIDRDTMMYPSDDDWLSMTSQHTLEDIWEDVKHELYQMLDNFQHQTINVSDYVFTVVNPKLKELSIETE